MPDPILDIDYIGPDTFGAKSSIEVESMRPDERVSIPGERLEPEPMSPPEIELPEQARKNLANYLDQELAICLNERMEQIAKFARLKQKYRTKFPEVPKDWPIANSSQLTVPTIKTAVNTLSARIYQTVMAADPLASIRARDPQWTDIANLLEQFLDTYNKEKIDVDELLDDVVTETIKLGTAIVECANRTDKRGLVTFDPMTNKYDKHGVVVFNGPTFYHIPLEDFWIRTAWQNHQEAPWCGRAMRLTWSEIKNMALSGQLNPDQINNIYRYKVQEDSAREIPDTIKADEAQEDAEPNSRDQFTIHYLAVRWDVDADGIEEELMIYYHWDSRTILRIHYNTFTRGRRPWIVFRYVRIEHRFYGEGLAEMLEHLQEEISTIHNQRIDNASIANLKIILVSKLIKGLSPGDRLWTGKIVKVTDVEKDVNTLSLGDPYRTTVQDENLSMGLVREVSGVGEVATGQAQPVSRTTATAQLSLLEELNRRFDKILKGIRRSIRQMHVHELDLFIQSGTNGLAETWFGTQGALLESFLQAPGDYIHNVLKVQVHSTKSTVNREVEFQSSIAVMNLIVQMGQQMLTLTQQLAPQASAVIAHELVKAVRPVFKKVMQYADAPSADEAISVLSVLERILPAPEMLGINTQTTPGQPGSATPGAATPGAGGLGQPDYSAVPAGNAGLGTMADILEAFGSSNRGGTTIPTRRRNGR